MNYAGTQVNAAVRYAVVCGAQTSTPTLLLMEEDEALKYFIEIFTATGEVERILDKKKTDGKGPQTSTPTLLLMEDEALKYFIGEFSLRTASRSSWIRQRQMVRDRISIIMEK